MASAFMAVGLFGRPFSVHTGADTEGWAVAVAHAFSRHNRRGPTRRRCPPAVAAALRAALCSGIAAKALLPFRVCRQAGE
jgi:hypothetical protein